MRNSWQDGRWLFEEVGLSIHGGTSGNFAGFVDIEDGDIATIWLRVDKKEGGHFHASIAPGSFLHTTIMPQIVDALPGMIEWQSGGRANLTAHSRAERVAP